MPTPLRMLPWPGFEPGLLRPQRRVLTTIRSRLLGMWWKCGSGLARNIKVGLWNQIKWFGFVANLSICPFLRFHLFWSPPFCLGQCKDEKDCAKGANGSIHKIGTWSANVVFNSHLQAKCLFRSLIKEKNWLPQTQLRWKSKTSWNS